MEFASVSGIVYDANPIEKKDTMGFFEGDEFILRHRQDVGELMEVNKALRNQHDGRFKETYNLALQIPAVVMDDLHRKGILHDPDRFKAWMRSEEADPWRVHPSRNIV